MYTYFFLIVLVSEWMFLWFACVHMCVCAICVLFIEFDVFCFPPVSFRCILWARVPCLSKIYNFSTQHLTWIETFPQSYSFFWFYFRLLPFFPFCSFTLGFECWISLCMFGMFVNDGVYSFTIEPACNCRNTVLFIKSTICTCKQRII